ncbi:hypothetical protein C9374_002764 [Naegleria lovaniensis]|uniref:Uncharacterized protein n=1 Tax=Naegleria lovaniensis TaxID=51637 RepID=A0AA88KL27_NAELO|nr:uncharacterized protein C9374_002764 [Naegleria lovaniensis]KAG2386318.1 hypothetical protein C9374_002764 [Naegleria lovaniensis]
MTMVAETYSFNRNLQSSALSYKRFEYDPTINIRQKTDISHSCGPNISNLYQSLIDKNPSVFHKRTYSHSVPRSVSPSQLYAQSTQQSETFTAYLNTLSENRRNQLEKIVHVPREKQGGFYSPAFSSFRNYDNLKHKHFKRYHTSLVDPSSEHPLSLSDCVESAKEIHRESRPLSSVRLAPLSPRSPTFQRTESYRRTPRQYKLVSTKSTSSLLSTTTPRSLTSSRPSSCRSGSKTPSSASRSVAFSYLTSTVSNSSSHKSSVRLLRNMYDQRIFESDIRQEEKEQQKIEQILEQDKRYDDPIKQLEEIDNFELRNGLRKSTMK